MIIELDDEYYNSLKKEEEDVKVNFRLYFIQEIDHYLLPDLLSDPDPNGTMVVRKELLKRYPPERPAIKNFESDVRKHVDPFEDREHKRDLEELSRELLQAIAEAVEELDSMSVYFMNSG